MKTVCVLSDTHRNLKDIKKLEGIFKDSDYIIHLGDHYDDLNSYYFEYKEKLYRVHGNCDYGSQKEIIIEIEGCKIFATHGDLYGVKRNTLRLEEKARAEGCNVVLYGHTHSAEVRELRGLQVINPGCMTHYAPQKSFAFLVINGEKCTAVINDTLL